MDTGNHGIARKLRPSPGPGLTLPGGSAQEKISRLSIEPDALPARNVREFVAHLALANGIALRRDGLDDFADATSRVAGDDVRLDDTGNLLVALKKNNVITGRQLARLMTNHILEVRIVRPIRRLPDGGLPPQH